MPLRAVLVLALATVVSTLPATADAQRSAASARPAPIVRTEAGQIDGTTTASGVRAYLGIPYAAPPVRALRWRDPQPVAAWTGVYHA